MSHGAPDAVSIKPNPDVVGLHAPLRGGPVVDGDSALSVKDSLPVLERIRAREGKCPVVPDRADVKSPVEIKPEPSRRDCLERTHHLE